MNGRFSISPIQDNLDQFARGRLLYAEHNKCVLYHTTPDFCKSRETHENATLRRFSVSGVSFPVRRVPRAPVPLVARPVACPDLRQWAGRSAINGNGPYSRRGASACPARCLSRPARSSRSCAACGASCGLSRFSATGRARPRSSIQSRRADLRQKENRPGDIPACSCPRRSPATGRTISPPSMCPGNRAAFLLANGPHFVAVSPRRFP